MKIHIKYFAAMRECCGKSEETLETEAINPKELFEQVTKLYPIKLEIENLKVAVNECYVGFDEILTELDTVVFIPPVAGG